MQISNPQRNHDLRLCARLDGRPGRERPAQATQGGGAEGYSARRSPALRPTGRSSVDRLSRDTTDLLVIAREMQRAGAGIRLLAEPYLDTTSDFAEIVFAILGLAAKLERRRILERTARGRADAKAKGIKFGRKPILTPHQQQEARKRLQAGETQRSVARSYNVSQSTISRLTGV
jgi:Resolvase, N terminal domain/Helix-turn-helix domain of resolvase